MNISNSKRALFTKGELLAAIAVGLVIAFTFSFVGFNSLTSRGTFYPIEKSIEQAIRECGGAPVTRITRRESTGTAKLFICPDGREIPVVG